MPTKKELEMYINFCDHIQEKQIKEIERLKQISGDNEIKELKSIIVDLKLSEKSKNKQIYSLQEILEKYKERYGGLSL